MTAVTPKYTALEAFGLKFTPMTKAHHDDLFAAIAHPIVFEQGFGGGLEALTHSAADFSEWASRHFKTATSHVYVITATEGSLAGALLGTTTLGDFDLVNEHAHIFSTALAPHVWGTHVNVMSKFILLERAFSHGFGRVKLQADSLNLRSRRAIEGLGGQFEGIIRRDKQRADGTWRDTAIFSILAEEWPAVSEKLERRIFGHLENYAGISPLTLG